MLNKIHKSPVFCALWTMLGLVIHFLLFRSKVNYDYQAWQRMVMALLAVVITLPVHELIHFVFMKLCYRGNIQIKIVRSPIGLPTFGTVGTYDTEKTKKWHHYIVYLAPFVFLTLIPCMIFAFCSNIGLLFFIISICNCAGCFYDILQTLIVANEE